MGHDETAAAVAVAHWIGRAINCIDRLIYDPQPCARIRWPRPPPNLALKCKDVRGPPTHRLTYVPHLFSSLRVSRFSPLFQLLCRHMHTSSLAIPITRRKMALRVCRLRYSGDWSPPPPHRHLATPVRIKRISGGNTWLKGHLHVL